MDFDAQLYVSFKSSMYNMKNSEAVLFRVALGHMFFNFHF